ncbi:hypothetical protein FXW78_53280 [Rhodococcus opacus]|nr:hypothetical protein [Rhodococcus opacus]RZL83079.1 MAG: hypothetical protein EOP32_08890 [Rhodococcus sp. (in: high G+C Gram-positive bacteria)]
MHHGSSRQTLDEGTDTYGGVMTAAGDSHELDRGVHVEVGGFDLFGDRELDAGAQDPGPGAPTIRVVSYSLFGDLRVRTR